MTNNLEPLINSICLSSLILSLYESSQKPNLLITEWNVARVVAFKSASCVLDSNHADQGSAAIHIAKRIPITSDLPHLAHPPKSISSVLLSKNNLIAFNCVSDTKMSWVLFIIVFYLDGLNENYSYIIEP